MRNQHQSRRSEKKVVEGKPVEADIPARIAIAVIKNIPLPVIQLGDLHRILKVLRATVDHAAGDGQQVLLERRHIAQSENLRSGNISLLARYLKDITGIQQEFEQTRAGRSVQLKTPGKFQRRKRFRRGNHDLFQYGESLVHHFDHKTPRKFTL
ncbi:hypothetical protein SDC9_182388 [bioreactor metagenome]|uniref:Uncharacterized protein n=1 Tax=bioreactor metagenome TaxID=1076179 RepID=A0A645HFL5_9ZZZZ